LISFKTTQIYAKVLDSKIADEKEGLKEKIKTNELLVSDDENTIET